MPVEGLRAKLPAWLNQPTYLLPNQSRRTRHARLAWRTWVPWVLVVIAAVIGLVSALNVWVKRQALSTDNWTNASTQLLENDKIRGALSVYLVNQLYENSNVTQRLQQRLPPALDPLAPQIGLGLEQVAIRATDQLLARPRIQQLWKEANRRAHRLFIAVLDGKKGILVSSGGKRGPEPAAHPQAARGANRARRKAGGPPAPGRREDHDHEGQPARHGAEDREGDPRAELLPVLPRARALRRRDLDRPRPSPNAADGGGSQRARRRIAHSRGPTLRGRLPRQRAHDRRGTRRTPSTRPGRSARSSCATSASTP
jgi:hypothetical protein